MANRFVAVQVEELHQVNAVLMVPVSRIEKLCAGGFVRWWGNRAGWVSNSGQGRGDNAYTDDMLIKTPGSFIVRN